MNPGAAEDDRLRLDRLPASFQVREITIGPGADRPYEPAEWHDTLVVVRRGTLEVVLRAGNRRRFSRDSILWLAGLPVRHLHNPGTIVTVLVAVSRARPA